MARKSRPVNPDDGPVQAFAHELRCLRESNGSPTYRVLSKTAGFSPTALGEAAGGARLPTLEVALAYAGACGGDPAWWRRRWEQAARLVRIEARERSETIGVAQAAPIAVADAPDAADVAHVADASMVMQATRAAVQASPETVRARARAVPSQPWKPRSRRLSRRPWTFRLGVIVSAAAAMATCGSAWTGSAGASSASNPAGCPAAAPTAGGFTGRTYGSGANERPGASLDTPILRLIPPGCLLDFTGYCLGDVVHDPTADAPDGRWFILSDHDVVASAVVHGLPPAALKPTSCAYNVPGPTTISFSATAERTGSGTILLQAAGPNVTIVGYAYFYRDSRAPQGLWHQIGLTDSSSTLGQVWQPSVSAGRDALVVAAACMGGQAPTGVAAAGVVDTGTLPSVSPTSLTAAQLSAAEQEACQYPNPDG